jgi:hypothetical protein
VLDYDGGILQGPYAELYRDRRLRMTPGERVSVTGLEIEVRAVTSDGRAQSARFTFDRPLDDALFRFYYWSEAGFAPFSLPRVGHTATLPPAAIRFGFS